MRILGFFITIFLTIAVFAQNPASDSKPTESNEEKEKQQKKLEEQALQMIDQAVGDAQGLKLAQNRALVYAVAGDLYWKFDEKRARALFRDAANEIINATAEAEKEKKDNEDPFYFEFGFGGIRHQILPLIAKHDADLALETMLQTRPAPVAEAMAKAAQPNAKDDGGMFNFNPERFRVSQEIALEQRFAVLAAEQNPDKAIKLIKDSLAKGISYNVLPLLQKLHKKDEKKSAALADDVVKKIVEMDLTKKRDDFQAAVRFLQYATNPNAPKNPKEKTFQFTEAQIKSLGVKIADTHLQPANSLEMTMGMTMTLPMLEKIVPEKIPLLKQKQAEAMKNLPPELKQMQQQQKIWNPNSTPEEILADLPKLNEFQKQQAYRMLASKIGQIEDEERAKKLIEQIPDEKTRERAREAFESGRINRAAKDGKLEDAKKLIGNLGKKKTQIQKLVALAMEYHQKNTDKDRETAAALMRDARAMISEYPEDEDELNDLMEVVRGYAVIEPAQAFRMFDPIVDQINDFVHASAILSKYNKRTQNFKKGELVMQLSGGGWENLLIYRYITQMQMLGKADLNRMNLFANRFQRPDARTIVKLYVAQGFLKEEKEGVRGNFENTGEIFMVGF
jgi:hypothetical protein